MTVTIGGSIVSAENEIIEVFNKNDELSSLVLEIKHSTEDEAWDMDLDVTVVDGSITDYYITGYDAHVRTSYSPDLYTHRITLFDISKRLERITMPSLSFKQALDTTTYTKLDVLDRALKLMIIEEYADRGDERIYDIAGVGTRDSNDAYIVGNLTGLAARLYDEKAPEFQFTTPTLKEIFDEVFSTLDGHTIVTGFTTIDIEYYNNDIREIALSDVDDITGSQSIEKNAQKFDIYMENAISENNTNKQAIVYPSTDAWASVRSQETEITTNNFFMELPYDIERVLKFEIWADVTIKYDEFNGTTTNGKTFNGEIKADVTNLLLFKRAWESLDFEFNPTDVTGSTDTWFNSGEYKNNSLYIDGNSIKGFHEDNDIFTIGSSQNWHTFLATAAYENGDLTVTSGYWVSIISLAILLKPSFNTGVEDFMYRITYVPKTNSRLQLEKDEVVATGTLFANQTDRIVDSELLGQNLKSKLDREGAKVLKFTKRCAYADRFKITDYYGDYKGVTVINNRQTQFTLSTITLSLGHVKRSERMTIANKPRMTAISGDTVTRHDIFNEYMILSLNTSFENNSFMQQDGINRFLDTLDNGTITSDNPVELLTWSGVTILLLPCISQGIENVLHFKFGFDNPLIAGAQLNTIDSTEVNQYYRYANTDATLPQFSFKLYGGYTPAPNTYTQSAKVAKEAPHYVATDIALTELYFDIDSLYVLKDSGEIYNMTYQMTIVSRDIYDILIGRKLATENLLVVKDSETVYLYTQATKFTDKIKIPSGATQYTLTTGTPSGGTEVKIVISSSAIRGTTELTTNFPTDKYWAIGNSDRDLYYAVNHLNEPIVYFNPKRKRSDL
jgi:hypothetical protein